MNYLPEKTIKYKTYIKTALVESLKPVFDAHVDKKLKDTKVTIDFPKDRQSFPTVVIRFYENEIMNSGVGHEERIKDEDDKIWKFKHYFYKGDIEFAIHALSALDRDLIADTLVQTISMGELFQYTNQFFNRIYPSDAEAFPDSIGHFININTDRITSVNESQTNVPWNAENDLQYTVSYRVGVFGEFYSLPPDASYEYISKVFLYPYTDGEDLPTGLPTGSNWI